MLAVGMIGSLNVTEAYGMVLSEAAAVGAKITYVKNPTPYKGKWEIHLCIEKWVRIKFDFSDELTVIKVRELIHKFSNLGITFDTGFSYGEKTMDWMVDWSFSCNDELSEDWADLNEELYFDKN